MTTQITYWAPKIGKRGTFPSKFQKISNLPFTPNSPLSATLNVSPALFSMAALETGYGKATDWKDFIHFSSAHRNALGNFLARRMDWILSSMHLNSDQVIPPLFARLVEVSEWGSLSYYLGQIGARLGAEAWLAGRVKRALHYGIYTSDAYIKVGAKVHAVLKSGVQKTPDLVIEDTTGEWHVFEAKGGGPTYRNRAVNKALTQLDAVRALGYSGSCTTPRSSVCAFTIVERPDVASAKALHIELIDPPSEQEGFDLHIGAEISHLRAMVIERLVLAGLSRSRRLIRNAQSLLDIRVLGSGRVYALLPDKSNWDEKAIRALTAYEELLEIFENQLSKVDLLDNQTTFSISRMADLILQRGLQRQYRDDVTIALQRMTASDNVVKDISGVGLSISRALHINDLIEEAEHKCKELRARAANEFSDNKWDAVDLRCGCLFLSLKPSQRPEQALKKRIVSSRG